MNDWFVHFPEILSAVIMSLGSLKGYEIYQRKKYTNGGKNDRRNGSNSFCDSDRKFIQGCFEQQTKELGLVMKTDRLEFASDIKDFIRSDGDSTREAVRSS